MTELIFSAFRFWLVSCLTIGMVASMTEFRFGARKLVCILALYSLWVLGSNLVLLRAGGELWLLRASFFTITFPGILLIHWASHDSPALTFFNCMTHLLASFFINITVRLLMQSHPSSELATLLVMSLLLPLAIWLEARLLRRPFLTLVRGMPVRWGVLSLIPLAFYGYLLFVSVWPGSYLVNPAQVVYLYAAALPLVMVYIYVFRDLAGQYRLQLERRNAALLTVEISALKDKLQSLKEAEESLRIQRHDLRHQIQAVTELLARGDPASALAFLDASRQQLDRQTGIRWCSLPILDAMLSSYFDQARNHDILVEANISLPDRLPVDEGELAIVLANALENAIHASLKLPRGQRIIRCRMMGSPGIMLEIANLCDGDVAFDSSGLPAARQEGHGLGVRSIAAFCRKNGAVCQFDLTDGWFRLRLVL